MAVKKINRRTFLIGLGGALIPMPFLPSLFGGTAFAAEGDSPFRFVSIRSMYGQIPDIFYPTRPTNKLGENIFHRPFSAGEVISPVIGESFKPVAQKLSLIRGLDTMSGGHNNTLFLAPGEVNSERGVGSVQTSFDMVLAQSSKFYKTPPINRSMKITSVERTSWGYSWFNGSAQAFDNVEAFYNRLFSSTKSSGGTNPKAARILKAIEVAKPGYDQLRRNTKLSEADQNRMANYMDHLSDVGKKMENLKNLKACTVPTVDDSTLDAIRDTVVDLSITALFCQHTGIVNIDFPWFGALPGETHTTFHGRSHWNFENGNFTLDPNNGREYLALVPGSDEEKLYLRYYTAVSKKVGELMSKMDSITESNGKTLLDNSITVWGNEFGGGSAHQGTSMPTLVAGTAGGKIEPGYWDYTYRPFLYYAGRADIYHPVGTIPYNNFLVSLFHLFGLNPADYEVGGKAGFGDFSYKKKYNFTSKGLATRVSLTEDKFYARYYDDAGRRRVLPGWIK